MHKQKINFVWFSCTCTKNTSSMRLDDNNKSMRLCSKEQKTDTFTNTSTLFEPWFYGFGVANKVPASKSTQQANSFIFPWFSTSN